MNQGIILTEDFGQFENDFEQKCGLDQLLPEEQTAQAQVNAFRDHYNDEAMANAKIADIVPSMGAENKESYQAYMADLKDGDIVKKKCHLASEKKRRTAMRDTFTYLSELITECQSRRQSRAEILSSASRYLMDLSKQNGELENSVAALKIEITKIDQTRVE